jgi:plastocyanin
MQRELLRLWDGGGFTALLVTHDVDEALVLADRVFVLSARPGRVLGDVVVEVPRPRHHDDDVWQMTQTGATRYDGVSYNSSGLMTASLREGPATTDTYSLTFAKPGPFTYICLLHPGMKARIHVRPVGTPYPFTQAQYDGAVGRQEAAAMRDGHALAARATRESSNHNVVLGIGDDQVSVIRFFPQHIIVRVGDTVTFTNRDAMETHTLTAGGGTSDPSSRLGDPTSFDGLPLNSGYLGMRRQFVGTYYGVSYRVKFVAADSYEVTCALHDDLGMKATVDVLH